MTDNPHDPLGALNATRPPDPVSRTATPTTPWTPGTQIEGDEGTITSHGEPFDGDPDWETMFDYWGLSIDEWIVVENTVGVNTWEMHGPDGELRKHRQFKARIRRRTSRASVPIDDTLRALADWQPRDVEPRNVDGGHAFVVCLADWQVGGHGGADAFVDRFTASLERVADAAERAVSEGATTLHVGALGDMVEGVMGQYEAQAFEVSLDLREQVRMVRHAEALALRTLAPMFQSTVAVAVPGNHGRNGYKVSTTYEDNSDLAAFEMVAELLHASGDADEHNVEFVLPAEKLVALTDAAGTRLLWAHGDQKKGPAQKMLDWWNDVSFTRWGDADAAHMLLTGHRHHLRVEEVTDERTFIVCPTLGGDSRWFSELGGGTSNPGTLTFHAAEGHWWGLDVL